MGTLGKSATRESKSYRRESIKTQEARLQAHGHHLPGQETHLANPWPVLILEVDWCGPWGVQIVNKTSSLGGFVRMRLAYEMEAQIPLFNVGGNRLTY